MALDQGRLRQIIFASNGDLIGVRSNGEIVRYRDLDDDGMFQSSGEVEVIADTGGNGNNAHVDEQAGYLYAGSPEGVVRFRYSAERDELGDPEAVIVNQPSSGTHSYHTVHVYDGWLYVHSGSENNFVAPAMPDFDTNRSVLKRFNLAEFDAAAPWDWTTGDVFVRGVRNMVGFTQDPDGRLFGVVNGIDNLAYAGQDIHLDNPGEDLLLLEQGSAYGYPYCFTAAHVEVDSAMVAPGTQLAAGVMGETDVVNPHDDAWCADNSAGPVTFLPPHSAPLDITFHASDAERPSALPEEWVGGAFVALHGSWNDSPSVGHRVVLVPFDDGSAEMPQTDADPNDFPFTVVFGGGTADAPADGTWGWSNGDAGEDPVRPVGVAISPVDGALYVSSDNGSFGGAEPAGVLYRIGTARD